MQPVEAPSTKKPRKPPQTPKAIADAIESIVYSSAGSIEIATRLGWLCRALRGQK